MHVRVRSSDRPDTIVVVESKLTKIEQFRRLVKEKFDVAPKLQRLLYGGKLLENGYTFHDYGIKLNDVVQLIVKIETPELDTSKSKVKADSPKKKADVYQDAESKFYEVGDLVDVRLQEEQGAWIEGRICRIVYNPSHVKSEKVESDNSNKENVNNKSNGLKSSKRESSPSSDKDSKTGDSLSKSENINESEVQTKDTNKSVKLKENNSPSVKRKSVIKSSSKSPKSKSITDYFSKVAKIENFDVCDTKNSDLNESSSSTEKDTSQGSLNELNSSKDEVNVSGVADDRSPGTDSETKHVQPASEGGDEKEEIDVGLLYIVEINYNDENERSEVRCASEEGAVRMRARSQLRPGELRAGARVLVNHNLQHARLRGHWYELLVERAGADWVRGRLLLGAGAEQAARVPLLQPVYALPAPPPPRAARPAALARLARQETEPRARPVDCARCGDDEAAPCRECGCRECAGKDRPDRIVLCDECDSGWHLWCHEPPLDDLPPDGEDWYCADCKRDEAPARAPVGRARGPAAKTTRDWGRGMACAGKTTSCAMPPNHLGPIPGVEVGMRWRFRIQLSECGVHRPPVSGIHGRDTHAAYSLVLSGGYEDDHDYGDEFLYTGSGGRDLSGNKRTAGQSCDQTLTRENKALARNCGPAGGEVGAGGGEAGARWRDGRPVRVVRSHKLLKHAPQYAPDEGLRYDGIYKVVKYYPETGKSGFRVWKYLLRRDDPAPAPWEPGAKRYPVLYPPGYLEAEAEKKAKKLKEGTKGNKKDKGRKKKLKESDDEDAPSIKRSKTEESGLSGSSEPEPALTEEELRVIGLDTVNSRLWAECLSAGGGGGRRGVLARVAQVFACAICQEVAAAPVRLGCAHTVCGGCAAHAAQCGEGARCPCCRAPADLARAPTDTRLQAALRTLLPGYDLR